jgi:hypothetical protein
MKKMTLTSVVIVLCISLTYGQSKRNDTNQDTTPGYKFSVNTSYLTFLNFGEEKTNTHHIEFHVKYNLTSKDLIGIKIATWKMFAPMGMPMQEQLNFDESNFYPGRLRESGIGVTYQRMLWKGLFATVEILPQLKTYFDETNKKISNGFKLYTSYHLGYHVSFFKDRMFVEPQIHCQYWPIDTGTPKSFKEKDCKWNNYFLFEPNLYIGVKF